MVSAAALRRSSAHPITKLQIVSRWDIRCFIVWGVGRRVAFTKAGYVPGSKKICEICLLHIRQQRGLVELWAFSFRDRGFTSTENLQRLLNAGRLLASDTSRGGSTGKSGPANYAPKPTFKLSKLKGGLQSMSNSGRLQRVKKLQADMNACRDRRHASTRRCDRQKHRKAYSNCVQAAVQGRVPKRMLSRQNTENCFVCL